MRNYELTLILDPNLGAEELTYTLEALVSFVQGKGGILLSQENKGKKALLAPIKNHAEGIVAVLKFTMDATHIADLEKQLKENAKVLRFLCLIAVSRKAKDKTPHLVPSLASMPQTPREQEATETKPMDLGEIDKKLEEIFKQP